MSQATAVGSAYDVIYTSELVYQPDCWKLCGDAHCCHYDRYKRFGKPEERGLTQIPLLAGEYAYMSEHGLLGQYASHERRITLVPGRHAEYVFQLLTVPADRGCPCDHGHRPTMCRLYPLLPTFDVQRGLVALDPNFGVFEEVEELTGAPRACPLAQVSFAQLQQLMRVVDAITADPQCLFSLMMYREVKAQFRLRMEELMSTRGVPAYQALSILMASGDYVDRARLAAVLDGLVERFRAVHDPGFVPAA